MCKQMSSNLFKNCYLQLFTYNSYICIQGFTLNNPQKLICFKAPTNMSSVNMLVIHLFLKIWVIVILLYKSIIIMHIYTYTFRIHIDAMNKDKRRPLSKIYLSLYLKGCI